MRVREGDTIGTKDGRYGVVTFVVTQDSFLVKEALAPEAECGTETEEFWTGVENVASIV